MQGGNFLKVAKKDIIEVKQHYEAVTNLHKAKLGEINLDIDREKKRLVLPQL